MMIAQRMDAVRNRSSGFDYLRIVLASSVILAHTTVICYGQAGIATVPPSLRVLEIAILPMFFALSGFLVAGSLGRSANLKVFFGLRILRIVPALAMEVALSALILGPLLTTVSLHDYFTSPAFLRYFLNIVGDVHFALPGMFPTNPFPNLVNGQLWTVPWELYCYIALGALALFGFKNHRWKFFALLMIAQSVFLVHDVSGSGMAKRLTVGGSVLLMSFLGGALIESFKERIAFDARMAVVAGAVFAACLVYPASRYLCPLPAAYLTVYLGLLNPPKVRWMFSGDYSYGLYLYGYPLQQTVASFGGLYRHAYVNFAIAYALAAGCAVFSWWVVEKRALALRKFLKPRAKPGDLSAVAAAAPLSVEAEMQQG
jgi:peptidoglycan/LPS O-acetylase OafA/YrhL